MNLLKRALVPLFLIGVVCLFGWVTTSHAADVIGSIDTEWNALGPNSKIIIEAFDDPKIEGATCYISRPTRGGLNPFAEQTSDASIACRQTGPLKGKLNSGGEVAFTESRSPIFKHLTVTRFWDEKRRVIIYVTTTTKLVNGSPKSSISVIPVR